MDSPQPAKHGHGRHGHGKHGHGPMLHEEHHAEKGKAKEAAVHPDIVHTGLGARIDQMAAKSPTLERELQTLMKRGWTIQYGKPDKGTFASRGKNKGITVDPNQKRDPLRLLRALAHEAGHAMYTPEATVPMDGLNRQQYIDRNVTRSLKDEGEATINNLQVRQELMKAKQGDIGVAGDQAKKYKELFKKYPNAKDHDKLREEIGKVFAKGEHPSTDPKLTYEQYYAKPYEKVWDRAHPPTHK